MLPSSIFVSNMLAEDLFARVVIEIRAWCCSKELLNNAASSYCMTQTHFTAVLTLQGNRSILSAIFKCTK